MLKNVKNINFETFEKVSQFKVLVEIIYFEVARIVSEIWNKYHAWLRFYAFRFLCQFD